MGAAIVRARLPLVAIGLAASWCMAVLGWQLLHATAPLLGLSLALVAIPIAAAFLWLSLALSRSTWLPLWAAGAPWLLAAALPFLRHPLTLPLLILSWLGLGGWAAI